jgi:hypothetical protein
VRFPITLDKQNRQTVARATDLRFSLQNSFTVCGGPNTVVLSIRVFYRTPTDLTR